MHERALNHCNLKGSYELIDIEENELEATLARLKNEGYAGFNVTIPYKEKIIDLLDSVDHFAMKIGAVNTVLINSSTLKTIGFNTDLFGFSEALFEETKRKDFSSSSAIILGSGGAARAVVAALQCFKFSKIYIAARSEHKVMNLIDDLSGLDQKTAEIIFVEFDQLVSKKIFDKTVLLVNATPLGQSRSNNTDSAILNQIVVQMPANCFVFDTVYASEGQSTTPLVAVARNKNLRACDGTLMLACQAKHSFELWTHKSASPDVMLGR